MERHRLRHQLLVRCHGGAQSRRLLSGKYSLSKSCVKYLCRTEITILKSRDSLHLGPKRNGPESREGGSSQRRVGHLGPDAHRGRSFLRGQHIQVYNPLFLTICGGISKSDC